MRIALIFCIMCFLGISYQGKLIGAMQTVQFSAVKCAHSTDPNDYCKADGKKYMSCKQIERGEESCSKTRTDQ